MHKYFYILFIFTISFSVIEAKDTTQMLQDLDVIKSTFETKYAPYEWKKSYFGWSLEEEINIAKIKIISLNSLTVKDYQRILHAFFISTRDYHVQDLYHSTATSFLPFEIKGVNNKYFFTDVNTRALVEMKNQGSFKGEMLPEIGNELLIFDSRTIPDVIEDLKFQELGNCASRTAQSFAERLLTKRFGKCGHLVPEGTILISFQTADGSVINAEIDWVHTSEKIQNHSYTTAMTTFGKQSLETPFGESGTISPKNIGAAESHNMLNHLAEMLQNDYTSLLNKQIGLSSKPEIKAAKKKKIEEQVTNQEEEEKAEEEAPEIDEEEESPLEEDGTPNPPVIIRATKRENIVFGQKLWEESQTTPFNAYIYQLPGSDRKIGYIRINTYMPPSNEEEANQLVLNLANSLHEMQLRTDALLVDQVNNPGGNLLYALALTSLLTDRPLIAPKNHVSLTQNEIAQALDKLPILFEAVEELEEFKEQFPESPLPYNSSSFYAGYPLDLSYMKSLIGYYEFMIDEWNNGKTFTSAFPISGIEAVQPHPISHYSKPILILVNSFDFSCADIVPAILQDNERAIVFGEQTAGAGGIVETHTYPNSFGLAKFSYTTSLAERINGTTIENLGVTPDVPYDLTEKDLLNGYTDYIEAVNQTLEKMVL